MDVLGLTRKGKVFWVLMLFALCWSTHCLGETADPYAALKKKYLHLRNTDPHIKREPEWRELINNLTIFAADKKHAGEAPSALYNASQMLQSIYAEQQGGEDLDSAESLLSTIVTQYPQSSLADDALVGLGDLHLIKRLDPEKAKETFEKLIESYPTSDLVEYAKGKLRIIEKEPEEGAKPKEAVIKGSGPVIVIDPGHGGEDFGGLGHSGLMEKDVVLDVAFALEKILIKELKAKVILTRKGDLFVPLQKRMEMANDAEADLFISLHTNASPTKTVSGFETFYLDSEGDAASRLLAERENASGGEEIDDISFMLSDLIQASKIPESAALAGHIQQHVVEHLSGNWDSIKALKVKKAPFYVLVGAHMPSVLVEMFFIDHPTEGVRLADKNFRQDLANGIFLGIKSYLHQ